MTYARLFRAFLGKEWNDLGRRRLVAAIYLGMPLAFSLVPLVLTLALRNAASEPREGAIDPLDPLLAAAAAIPELAGLDPHDALTLFLLRQTSVLLLMVPIVLTTLSGAYSIVGEKTERTLEPLLATPLSDLQLLLAKLVALGIPAVLATIAGGLIGVVAIDVVLFPTFNRLVLPDAAWLATLFLLVPLTALLGLLVTLAISARSTDPQSAQQVSGLLAVPFVLLVLAAVARPLAFHTWALPLLGIGLLLLDALLFLLCLSRFNREEVLTRWR